MSTTNRIYRDDERRLWLCEKLSFCLLLKRIILLPQHRILSPEIMLSLGKKGHFGERRQSDFKCKCGSKSYWQYTMLKTLNLGFFSLVPLPAKKLLKCTKCQREYEPCIEQLTQFKSVSRKAKLAQVSGWPFIVAIGVIFNFFLASINPDDSRYRTAPRIGDIYFIDYHKLTRDEKYSTHPYRIAKLISISEDTLELKVSGWSHSRKLGVLRDFTNQMFVFNSVFMPGTLVFRNSELLNNDKIFSIRRRNSVVDVEETQSNVIFDKYFFPLPWV